MPSSEAADEGIDLDALSPEALDHLDGGVIGLDAAGVGVMFSQGASALTGLSRDAVLGRDYFREVMPGPTSRAFAGAFSRARAWAISTSASNTSSAAGPSPCARRSGCGTAAWRGVAPSRG